MLGREPIVDRDDHQSRFTDELAAEHVVRVEIADHPATAVEVHQRRHRRCRRGARRPINPHRDRTDRRLGDDVGDRADLRRRRRGRRPRLAKELTRFFRRQRVIRGPPGLDDEIEHRLRLRIQSHGHSPARDGARPIILLTHDL